MEKWRLLLRGSRNAFSNMALDEAIMRILPQNTISFYGWEPSAISIGYFQSMEEEVDTEACRRYGIDCVRRVTGGGAVYHDSQGEITYSIIVPEEHEKIPHSILESYNVLCGGIVNGLRTLGLNAEFKPVNDIVVNGKKISGNAHTRRNKRILQHGTILCDVNPKLMFSVLKVPDEKIRDKMIKTVEERVTSIKKELGDVDKNKVVDALITGFENVLGVELVKGNITKEELLLAEELKECKYGTKEWNFKR